HAARALKLHQGGPIVVEPVEDFRVNGVGGLEPLLVFAIAALGWKLLMLRSIEIEKRSGHRVTRHELLALDKRLEQPPPDDFEAFFGAGRPPGRLYAPDGIVYPAERLAPALAADFLVACLRMGRAAGVGGGQADNEQTAFGKFCRLG